jgi:predicted CXXCH cytochrome family protein
MLKTRFCVSATIICLALTGFDLKAAEIEHHAMRANPAGKAIHCLACHDGVQSKYAAVCIGKCEQTLNHPILKPYPPPRKESEFNSRAEVRAKGIKFEKGKITCISCHNIRKKKPAHLVVDNRGSRLCLTCHRK